MVPTSVESNLHLFGLFVDPPAASDFEILYNELEAWRLQETRRIKDAGLPKEKEQEVLQQLLHKETKLLQVCGAVAGRCDEG